MDVDRRTIQSHDMDEHFLPCPVKFADDITKGVLAIDAICVLDPQAVAVLTPYITERRSFDKAVDSEISVFKVTEFKAPVVYVPIPKPSDYDNVRIFIEAAARGVARAIKAGAKRVMLVATNNQQFPNSALCSILGALDQLYVPIQLREDVPSKKQQLESLSIHITNVSAEDAHTMFLEALRIESGRMVARDIGGGDPERMAPPRVEEYIRKTLTRISINVISDTAVLQKEYPLFQAVNRAANSVPRHQGRVIYLEYKPPKPARKSLLLVGKGVTYDTGGADIKAGGVMAGMSRDKCGAAAVAGFMHLIQTEKPKDIHVIAALCIVRNSVGEECYVSDEIITSRAGVRVRVGNTDAEGRMAMADVLCKMKELAMDLPDPHLFTVATLTGHACISAGEGQSIVIDNSFARREEHAQKLQKVGEKFGEPFEISVLRNDDFKFNEAKVIGEDVVQCNNLPSTRTPRGHQVPCAFMIVASGLDQHGVNSEKPIKYSHIDIAASAGEYPKMPTGAPILALAKTHLS